MARPGKLTPKQERFAQIYVKTIRPQGVLRGVCNHDRTQSATMYTPG